jgi:hypothetical protein
LVILASLRIGEALGYIRNYKQAMRYEEGELNGNV